MQTGSQTSEICVTTTQHIVYNLDERGVKATSFLKTGYESAIKNHKDSARLEQLTEKKISKATTCNTLFCWEARCASATKKNTRIQQTFSG